MQICTFVSGANGGRRDRAGTLGHYLDAGAVSLALVWKRLPVGAAHRRKVCCADAHHCSTETGLSGNTLHFLGGNRICPKAAGKMLAAMH